MRLGGQVLVLCCATAQLLAQREDSVRYFFTPVVVEDSAQVRVAAAPTAQIRRQELERIPATTLADAVQGMPGVFVRNYGGLGGLKTVTIRGATASQTTVVLEGIRLNSITNGLVDLGQFPTAILDAISIERGSRSAVWGANSIGGTLEIRLRQPNEGICARGTIGAFGERSVELESSYRIGAHILSALGTVQSSRGNYPFTFNEFGKLQRIERSNGDALLGSGIVQWRLRSSHAQYGMTLLARVSERGAPGAVLQGAIENTAARLSDKELLALASATIGDDKPWALTVALRIFDQFYRDSLARYRGPQGAHDHFFAQDAAVVIELPSAQICGITLGSSVEAYGNTLRGDLYRFGSGSSASRLPVGVVVRSQHVTQLDSSAVLLVESVLRGDHYSDVPSAVVGLLQGRLISKQLPFAIRASVGTGYRPPSFNELYYQNFGSKDIRPEQSLDVGAGIVYRQRSVTVEFDAFTLWVRNQIIAIPRSAITWSVQNAGRVFSRGIEGALHLQGDSWHLRATGTAQSVTYDDPTSFTYGKQVLYTPSMLGMIRFEHQLWKCVRLFAQATYFGIRFTQTDNAPSSALPPVGTMDCSVEYEFPLHNVTVAIRGELLNAFDAQYALIRNFPMPGRAWRFHMTVRWRHM